MNLGENYGLRRAATQLGTRNYVPKKQKEPARRVPLHLAIGTGETLLD